MICSSGRTIVIATGNSSPFKEPSGDVIRNHLPINVTARRRRSPMRSNPSPLVLTPGASALFSARELNRFVTVIQLKEDKQRNGKVWVSSRKRNIVCCVSPSPTPVVDDDEVAVRRGLAMRRVLEDNGGDGNSVRDFSFFTTKRGDTLFTQSWTRVGSVKNRSILIFVSLLVVSLSVTDDSMVSMETREMGIKRYFRPLLRNATRRGSLPCLETCGSQTICALIMMLIIFVFFLSWS